MERQLWMRVSDKLDAVIRCAGGSLTMIKQTKYVLDYMLPGGTEINLERRGVAHVNLWLPWDEEEVPEDNSDSTDFYPATRSRNSNLTPLLRRGHAVLRLRLRTGADVSAVIPVLFRSILGECRFTVVLRRRALRAALEQTIHSERLILGQGTDGVLAVNGRCVETSSGQGTGLAAVRRDELWALLGDPGSHFIVNAFRRGWTACAVSRRTALNPGCLTPRLFSYR